MVAHAFSPSTREAEAGGFLSRGQSGLQSEFQDNQGYTEKPCLETKQNKTKQNKTKQNKTKQNKQKKDTMCFPRLAHCWRIMLSG